MSAAREENPRGVEVDRFVLDEIESVPHIEALLILWNSRPSAWSVPELGVYVVRAFAFLIILAGIVNRNRRSSM